MNSLWDQFRTLSAAQSAVRKDSQGISHRPRKFRTYETIASNITQGRCPICNQNNRILLCSEFLRMSVSGRILSIRDHKYCTNWLGVSHDSKRCHNSEICYICKQKHHSLLYRSESPR